MFKILSIKFRLFGLHFASLDIRQDSRVHHGVFTEIVSHPEIQSFTNGLPKNYLELSEDDRFKSINPDDRRCSANNFF